MTAQTRPWHMDQDALCLAMTASAKESAVAIQSRNLCDHANAALSIAGGKRNAVPLTRRVDMAVATMGLGDECTVTSMMAMIDSRNRGRVREALARLVSDGTLIAVGTAVRKYGAGLPSPKAYRVAPR